jgi:membrane protein implicated in regulation of membrane protease activity
MKSYLIDHGGFAAATLTVPVVAIAWLLMVPATVSMATFSAAAAIAIAAGAIGLRTWRSGQATGTIGHVIHDAEAGPKPDRDAASRTGM